MSDERLAGNIAALIASVLFGAAVVATRVAVRDVSPTALAVFRFGQGGLILFAIMGVRSPEQLRVERRDWRLLVVLGAILFAVFPLLFNLGLRWTTASRGAVMLATMPLWSAGLARLAGREQLTRRQLAGVVLSCLGVVAVFARGAGEGDETWRALTGNGLLLLASAVGAAYGVLSKPLLGRYPPLTVTAYTMTIGTVMLLPFALFGGLPEAVTGMDGKVLALVLYLGVVGGALAYFLILFGLARLSPTQSTVYININPLVAVLLGATLLGEDFSIWFAGGFVIVLAGVILTNWPRRSRARGDDPADHHRRSVSTQRKPSRSRTD